LALNIYISENKLFTAFKYTSIVEYCSILPYLITLLGGFKGNKFISLTRTLRYTLIYKMIPIFARRSMEVAKHIFSVFFILNIY